MTIPTKTFVVMLALSLSGPALAQYVAPHSNDPHPPAVQPSYQLPNPLSRPGIAGYPNAAHSNDPHFNQTESRPTWPSSPVTPSAQFPSTSPGYSSVPYWTTKQAPRGKAAETRRRNAARITERCTRRGRTADECR